jgi:poly(3-hydroxybutyrate) depolymerase
VRPVSWRRVALLVVALVAAACSTSGRPEAGTPATTGRSTRTIELDGVRVEVVIERPAAERADAVLLFHGTVGHDDAVLQAAHDTLDAFGAILDRDDLLLVSVAYPEEGLLMGDNLAHAQAALQWVQRHAAAELGIAIARVFLAGHSQGGYLATRLNTLHTVDGVIANAPGPLDLVWRCGLEESGRVETSLTCARLSARYGTTTTDPAAYRERSLLSFTSGHRADILFVQGQEDSPIQMRSWPRFREELEACTDCRDRTFLEVLGQGHAAMFRSAEARRLVNDFLRDR